MRRLRWPRPRPLVQGGFFLFFLFLLLQTTYRGADEIPYPVNVFLRFDPLVLLSTFLSTRGIPWMMLPALARLS